MWPIRHNTLPTTPHTIFNTDFAYVSALGRIKETGFLLLQVFTLPFSNEITSIFSISRVNEIENALL